MDLVDDPVHDPLEELPWEVKSLGSHVVRSRDGAKDDNLLRLANSHGRNTSGTYITIDSLVSHHTHRTTGVDGGISCLIRQRLAPSSRALGSNKPWEIWS